MPVKHSDDPVDLDDLLCAEAVDRPADFYARLRDVHPVYWNKRWNGWIVTGYSEVLAGFRDHAGLSSDRFAGPFGRGVQGGELLAFLSKFFVWKDPPEHTRMRELVHKAFTPRSVELLRPRVHQLVRSLMADLTDQPGVDFLRHFAFSLPITVIAEYLGVPVDTREEIRGWSEDLAAVIFVRGDDPRRTAKAQRAMGHLAALIRPLVQQRRRDPQEDLITSMVRIADRTRSVSDEELIANVVALIFAGHETTMNLLANGIVAFNQFPGQWQLLRKRPALAGMAADEVLRYDCPVRAQARWVAYPHELGGQALDYGDRVLLVQYAANRDPSHYSRPDELDITRTPNRHMGFGHGIHTCLGASLARMEAEIAFAELARTFPHFTVDDHELRYEPTVVSRSLTQLHVTFHESTA